MSSLRFRLPALFLAGVTVAALVTALLAVRLFQDYTRDRTLADLHRQAAGLAQLYAEQARQGIEERRRAPSFARPKLERATGTRLYYAGVSIFPGQDSGLRPLPLGVLDRDLLAERQGAGGRVQAARHRQDLSRGRGADSARWGDLRRARSGETAGRASRALDRLARTARAGLSGRAWHRRSPRSGISRAGSRSRSWPSRPRPTGSRRGATTSGSPSPSARTRSPT